MGVLSRRNTKTAERGRDPEGDPGCGSKFSHRKRVLPTGRYILSKLKAEVGDSGEAGITESM